MKYIILLLILSSCGIGTKPTFQVGDCVQSIPNHPIEEWSVPDAFINRIDQVGKFSYRYSIWVADGWMSLKNTSFTFNLDTRHKKVVCPTSCKEWIK